VHEERVRRQGNKNRDYQITELSEAGFVAAPERDEYFPVCFVAPYEANRPVAGFNLASEPARREVFERLIKSGEPVAVSGRVPPLVEEDAGTALMVVGPIYRKSSPLDTPDQRRENLIGFVVNEVRVDVVVERALWNDGAVDIRMQVFDEFAVPGPTLLHTYPPDSGQAGALAAGHSQAPAIAGPFFKDVLTVPGRNWSVHCWPTEQYTILRKPWLPPVASLVIGLLFAATLLVSGLLLRARPR
jgi:CHASE1-domain containing sensor protein